MLPSYIDYYIWPMSGKILLTKPLIPAGGSNSPHIPRGIHLYVCDKASETIQCCFVGEIELMFDK